MIPFYFRFWAPVMFALHMGAFRCGLTTKEICIHEENGRRGLGTLQQADGLSP